jgi:hypothetical protein
MLTDLLVVEIVNGTHRGFVVGLEVGCPNYVSLIPFAQPAVHPAANVSVDNTVWNVHRIHRQGLEVVKGLQRRVTVRL